MILIKLQILRRMLRGVKIWCQALSNVLNTLTPLVDLEHFLLFLRQPIADGDIDLVVILDTALVLLTHNAILDWEILNHDKQRLHAENYV